MKTTWFITGAGSGIGLEFVRQLSIDPNNLIFASLRDPAKAVDLQTAKSLSKTEVHIIKLDVGDEDSVQVARQETECILTRHGGPEAGIDFLINNAGFSESQEKVFNIDVETFNTTMRTNALGPVLMAKHFLTLIKKGRRKVIMNMSTNLASCATTWGSSFPTYSMSKAALNIFTVKQAAEEPELIPLAVHPGWVRTKLGGSNAEMSIEECVTPFIAFLKRVSKEHAGKFFNNHGEPIPW